METLPIPVVSTKAPAFAAKSTGGEDFAAHLDGPDDNGAQYAGNSDNTPAARRDHGDDRSGAHRSDTAGAAPDRTQTAAPASDDTPPPDNASEDTTDTVATNAEADVTSADPGMSGDAPVAPETSPAVTTPPAAIDAGAPAALTTGGNGATATSPAAGSAEQSITHSQDTVPGTPATPALPAQDGEPATPAVSATPATPAQLALDHHQGAANPANPAIPATAATPAVAAPGDAPATPAIPAVPAVPAAGAAQPAESPTPQGNNSASASGAAVPAMPAVPAPGESPATPATPAIPGATAAVANSAPAAEGNGPLFDHGSSSGNDTGGSSGGDPQDAADAFGNTLPAAAGAATSTGGTGNPATATAAAGQVDAAPVQSANIQPVPPAEPGETLMALQGAHNADNPAPSGQNNPPSLATAFGSEFRPAGDTAAITQAAYSGRAEVPPPVQQVAIQITRAIQDGNDRLTVELKPVALGRVSVNLEVGHDNRVIAVIAAERPETLELLQRDSRALERALQDAGLDTDSGSLSFNLRGENGGNGENGAPSGSAGTGNTFLTHDGDGDGDPAMSAGYSHRIGNGSIDIRV